MLSKPTAAIIGAGSYYSKLKSGIFKYLNPKIILDVNDKGVFTSNNEKKLFHKYDGVNLNNYSNTLNKCDCVMLLTPPNVRIELISQLIKYCNNIFVDKPLVVNMHLLKNLDKITRGGEKIYCSDFYSDIRASIAINKIVLAKYSDKYHINNLLKIYGAIDEGGINKSFAGRDWLWDPNYGDVTLDLMYHLIMIIYNILTPKQWIILNNEYKTRKSETGSVGEISRHVISNIDNIYVDIHTSKYNVKNNRYLRFLFKNNYIINIDFDDNNKTTFFENESLTRLTSSIPDYYEKVSEKYADFLKTNKKSYGWIQSINTIKTIQIIRSTGICKLSA